MEFNKSLNKLHNKKVKDEAKGDQMMQSVESKKKKKRKAVSETMETIIEGSDEEQSKTDRVQGNNGSDNLSNLCDNKDRDEGKDDGKKQTGLNVKIVMLVIDLIIIIVAFTKGLRERSKYRGIWKILNMLGIREDKLIESIIGTKTNKNLYLFIIVSVVISPVLIIMNQAVINVCECKNDEGRTN